MDRFSRFLEIAALCNSQQINFSSLASDVGMSEKTIAQWFTVLEDTLVAVLLPCFSKTIKRKSMSAPKLYFFDCGVVNAMLSRYSIELSTPEAASALENLVFTHLQGWCSYGPRGRKLHYWRSVSKEEVDFIVTRDTIPELAIEVKSTIQPKPEHFKGLRAFGEEFLRCQKILLFFTDRAYTTADNIRVEPLGPFLKNGWQEFCETEK